MVIICAWNGQMRQLVQYLYRMARSLNLVPYLFSVSGCAIYSAMTTNPTCPNCQRLLAELESLQAQLEKAQARIAALEAELRRDRRQAAPFSRDEPKPDPSRRGAVLERGGSAMRPVPGQIAWGFLQVASESPGGEDGSTVPEGGRPHRAPPRPPPQAPPPPPLLPG